MTDASDKAENTDPAKSGKAADKQGGERGKSGRWGAAGLGAAIGSAAIVAALLYVNRGKGKDKS